MKLVEFDLDAPEATKRERAYFRSESRTISALYERCFEGLDVPRGWKVLIECVPSVTRDNVRDLLGVLTLQVSFDIRSLDAMSSEAKKRAMLDVLHSGLVAVAKAEGWRSAPFENARRCVLEKELVNEWWWRKPKWNRTRSLKGQLWCVHEMDAFRAWLVVLDKNGEEVARQLVLETSPSEFEFVAKLGDTRWTDRRQFALVAKDGSEVGAIETPQS
jgi:hypothetical protein